MAHRGNAFEILRAHLKVLLRVRRGCVEGAFDGASRARVMAHRGRVEGAFEGAFEGALRARLKARRGHIEGCS